MWVYNWEPTAEGQYRTRGRNWGLWHWRSALGGGTNCDILHYNVDYNMEDGVVRGSADKYKPIYYISP